MIRRGLAALVAGVSLVALVGCGFSARTDVVVDEAGPTVGPGGAPNGERNPTERLASDDAVHLITSYLAAAAGDHYSDAAHEQVLNRVKSYIAPGDRDGWNPGGEVNLVRWLDTVPITLETDRYQVRVQQLGVLDKNGRVNPPVLKATSYTFQISAVPGQKGLFIHSPKNDLPLLLAETALRDFYDSRPIYFWDAEGDTLVPDLRYLSRALAPEQQSTRLFDLLLDGPAEWLAGAVQPVPAGSKRSSNVTTDNEGRTVVNLAAAAAANSVSLDRLASQLSWTLRPPDGLQMQIEGRPTGETRTNFKQNNRAVWTAVPNRYAVVSGALRRIASSTALPPLPLSAKINTGVVAGAVARGERAFALVRKDGRHSDGSDRVRLHVGPSDSVRPTTLTARTVSQLIWLDHEAAKVLVLADGRLRQVVSGTQVSAGTPAVSAVSVDDAIEGHIDGVSVAPDGHRVALVAGGKLYVAPLLRGGKVMSVGPLRWVPTRLSELQGVAFTGEERLVIVGSEGGSVRLTEVTVDGASQADPNTVSRQKWDAGKRSPGWCPIRVSSTASEATSCLRTRVRHMRHS